jgi:hypothetical protein
MVMLFTGCTDKGVSTSKENSNKEISTISDIVYKKNSADCEVYIKENGKYESYYVLTENYNDSGCVLLLRKFLIDENIAFNSEDFPVSLYENSILDNFLEKEFINVFDEDFKNKLQEVEIDTIKKEFIRSAFPETTIIKRRIFALSFTELGLSKSSTEPVEGKKLSFFPDGDSRIAYKSNGKASTWWTRTSHTWQTYLACGFSPDGTLSAGEVTMENGVRPAFCLPSDTKIVKSEVEGKEVYVVE